MKKVNHKLLTLTALTIVMLSCNGKAQEGENNAEQTQKVENNTAKATTTWKAKVEELAKKKPLTDEEFATWYPKSIFGLPATNVRSTANEEMATFHLTYYANKQRLDLTLSDGAGKRGARLTAPARIIADKEIDDKLGEGYIKTVKKDGIIARESYQPENNTYTIKLMFNNRYYVVIKTMNLGKDKTWAAIETFQFNKLRTQ